MNDLLVHIDAPHYCAGMVARNGVVIRAADIIKWTIGKDLDFCLSYFHRKNFKVIVDEKIG